MDKIFGKIGIGWKGPFTWKIWEILHDYNLQASTLPNTRFGFQRNHSLFDMHNWCNVAFKIFGRYTKIMYQKNGKKFKMFNRPDLKNWITIKFWRFGLFKRNSWSYLLGVVLHEIRNITFLYFACKTVLSKRLLISDTQCMSKTKSCLGMKNEIYLGLL